MVASLTERVLVVPRLHLLVVASLAVSTALPAQEPAGSLVPGVRARLSFANGADRRVVILERVSDDSLFVRDVGSASGPGVGVARSALIRLEVFRGRGQMARFGAAAGLVAGAIAGGVIASNGWTPCRSEYSWGCWLSLDRRTTTIIGAVVGGSLGSIAGRVVGSIASSDKWVDVPPGRARGTVSALRHGRVGFGATVVF